MTTQGHQREEVVMPPRLYRLDEAVRLFFPPGAITVKSLRNEALRGRLQIFRLAGKLFVTADAIMAMLERCKCPVQENPQDYISANTNTAPRAGSSLMDREKRAQDALKLTFPARKKR